MCVRVCGCARESVCVGVVREKERVCECVSETVCVVDGFYIVLFSSLKQCVCERERESGREMVCASNSVCMWLYT